MFTFGGGFGASSLQALAAEMGQTLSGIAGQVQTRWNKQHKSDGSHGDVTATSMRAGQIGAGGIYTVVATSSWEGNAPLEVPAGVGVVQITVPATFSPIIYGIRQAGQQPGDMLFVGLSPETEDVMFLADRAHGGPISPPLGTEIAFEASLTTAVPPTAFWVNSPQSPVLLVYLPGRGTNRAAAWCIPQMVDTLST